VDVLHSADDRHYTPDLTEPRPLSLPPFPLSPPDFFPRVMPQTLSAHGRTPAKCWPRTAPHLLILFRGRSLSSYPPLVGLPPRNCPQCAPTDTQNCRHP